MKAAVIVLKEGSIPIFKRTIKTSEKLNKSKIS